MRCGSCRRNKEQAGLEQFSSILKADGFIQIQHLSHLADPKDKYSSKLGLADSAVSVDSAHASACFMAPVLCLSALPTAARPACCVPRGPTPCRPCTTNQWQAGRLIRISQSHWSIQVHLSAVRPAGILHLTWPTTWSLEYIFPNAHDCVIRAVRGLSTGRHDSRRPADHAQDPAASKAPLVVRFNASVRHVTL